MKKNRIILITIILFHLSSCSRLGLCKDDELSLKKENYTNGLLKTQGYYYNDLSENAEELHTKIYYLYQNGIFFTTGLESLDIAKTGKINVDVENEFGKQIKAAWGLFTVEGNSIEIEHWQSSINGCEKTVYYKGEILNDSTFEIKLLEYRRNGKVNYSEEPNYIYRFKELKEKPDSTNNFIK